MNFKKLKLWKLLAVGEIVGLVATVPIITTACSSTTQENKIIDETITWKSGSGFVTQNDNVLKDLKIENSSIKETGKEDVLQVSAKGLAIDAGWLKNKNDSLSVDDFKADKQSLNSTIIDSQSISNSIGIQNVTFNSLKLESLSKDGTFDISNENYNGKFKLTLNATPNDGYTWKDNSNKAKDITIDNLVINVDGIKFDISKLYKDGKYENTTKPDKLENQSGNNEFIQMLKSDAKLKALQDEINSKIESDKINFKGVKVVVDKNSQKFKIKVDGQAEEQDNTNILVIKFVGKPGFYTSDKTLISKLNTDTDLILKNASSSQNPQTPPDSGGKNIEKTLY